MKTRRWPSCLTWSLTSSFGFHSHLGPGLSTSILFLICQNTTNLFLYLTFFPLSKSFISLRDCSLSASTLTLVQPYRIASCFSCFEILASLSLATRSSCSSASASLHSCTFSGLPASLINHAIRLTARSAASCYVLRFFFLPALVPSSSTIVAQAEWPPLL